MSSSPWFDIGMHVSSISPKIPISPCLTHSQIHSETCILNAVDRAFFRTNMCSGETLTSLSKVTFYPRSTRNTKARQPLIFYSLAIFPPSCDSGRISPGINCSNCSVPCSVLDFTFWQKAVYKHIYLSICMGISPRRSIKTKSPAWLVGL